ncbi:hypothetical protein LU676_25000 [Pseudomonas alloputida]|nr:hypothetical protein [Pseudomonas alloputida]MCE0906010.1 hypothetical protein [Pseudomonas alloputida]
MEIADCDMFSLAAAASKLPSSTILQLLDPFGNRRLRHVQFGGGGLETAQLDNPVNGFDLLQGDHVYYLGTAAVYGEWDSDCPLKAMI